ncbi:MAG: hypothetical protein JWS12_590 [Candidatus Saccharibacteria bacterium]|nr:hypothetical protein [Candidatus Saccharibacteria bacterium]
MKKHAPFLIPLLLAIIFGTVLLAVRHVAANHINPPACSFVRFDRCPDEGYFTNQDSDGSRCPPGDGLCLLKRYNSNEWLWPRGHYTAGDQLTDDNTHGVGYGDGDIRNANDFLTVMTYDLNRNYFVASCNPNFPVGSVADVDAQGAANPGTQTANCWNNSMVLGAAYIINTILGYEGHQFQDDILVQYAGCNPTKSLPANDAQAVCNGIQNARNYLPKFKQIINYYEKNGWVNWNYNKQYKQGEARLDTVAINHTADVASYVNSDEKLNDYFIVFYNHQDPEDHSQFQINKFCGNITDNAVPLRIPQFTLSPNSEAPKLVDASNAVELELPVKAQVRGFVNVSKGPVQANVTRTTYVKRPAGVVPNIVNLATDKQDHLFSAQPTYLDTVFIVNEYGFGAVPGGVRAGDKVCLHVHIAPHTGYAQADGSIAPGDIKDPSADSPAPDPCTMIFDRPYFRAYGRDVYAGIGRGQDGAGNSLDCNPGLWPNDKTRGAGITAYNRAGGLGSGSQFASLAVEQISSFGNDILHNPKLPVTQLSFSNTVPGPGGGGGNLSNYFIECPHEYFFDSNKGTPTNINPNNPVKLDTLGGVTKAFATTEPAGNSLKVHGNLVDGENIVIYVDGDVTIDGDITYASSNWLNRDHIPSLAIVARGNINITHDVNEIAGFFIAEHYPAGGAPQSKITTCTKSTGSFYLPAEQATMQSECNRQLIVRGQFIAQYVRLLRTFSSLRYSNVNEDPQALPTPHCGIASPSASRTCAAEVFYPTPLLYLSKSALPPISDIDVYDNIISLPPVL